MYVAAKRLRVDGGFIEPGETVVGFEKWKTVPRLAALAWKSVLYVPDQVEEKSEVPAEEPSQPAAIQCECGKSFEKESGLKIHKARFCRK